MTAVSPLNVLMVEDNPGDVRLIREVMREPESKPVRIGHAVSLSAGVDTLRGQHFDAVLLDLSLPDSQGLETVRRLRRLSPQIPIVVITSLDDEETALRAMAEGAQDYLVKGKDTDRRIVERALRYAIERHHAQEELAEARKFEAMGRLAGAVAHEYNNLMTTILGCSSMLFDAVHDDPELSALVTRIEASGRRAAAVTEQVLAAGGRKPLVAVSMSLNAAIRGAEAMLRGLLGDCGSLVIRLGADADAVLFNAREVEHVLAVLALNALETTGPCGAFEVQTSNQVLDEPAARALGLRAGLHVVLTVRDSGRAGDDAASAYSLEPVAKPKQPGSVTTGLSLAGVNGTLRAHGARIAAHAEPDGGTTFNIYFPHRSQTAEGTR